MNNLIEQLTILCTQVVLAAIERMEFSRFQVVFVVDEDGHLKGLITNGDLRRHLIQGGSTADLVTACMNTDFRSVSLDASREELL